MQYVRTYGVMHILTVSVKLLEKNDLIKIYVPYSTSPDITWIISKAGPFDRQLFRSFMNAPAYRSTLSDENVKKLMFKIKETKPSTLFRKSFHADTRNIAEKAFQLIKIRCANDK